MHTHAYMHAHTSIYLQIHTKGIYETHMHTHKHVPTNMCLRRFTSHRHKHTHALTHTSFSTSVWSGVYSSGWADRKVSRPRKRYTHSDCSAFPLCAPTVGTSSLSQSSLHVFHKCGIMGFPEEPGGCPLPGSW